MRVALLDRTEYEPSASLLLAELRCSDADASFVLIQKPFRLLKMLGNLENFLL